MLEDVLPHNTIVTVVLALGDSKEAAVSEEGKRSDDRGNDKVLLKKGVPDVQGDVDSQSKKVKTLNSLCAPTNEDNVAPLSTRTNDRGTGKGKSGRDRDRVLRGRHLRR